MIIFFGEGFITFLVILGFLAILGVFGAANTLLQVILDHWYILLLAMLIKNFLDYFLYSTMAKNTTTRSVNDKIVLKKAKNQMMICNTITNIIIFCSMYLFLKFEITIIDDHMFLSVIYAIVYFTGILSVFLQTCIQASRCFDIFLDGSNLELEKWIGGTYDSSPAIKYKKWQVVVCAIFTISLIIPSLFWKFMLLSLSVVAFFLHKLRKQFRLSPIFAR